MVRRLIHFTRRTRAFRSGQRRFFRVLLSFRGSAESIALGISIGVFVAFTPTVGFQMIIAAALATLFRASRPAAIIPVWITNLATIPPIYLFVYKVGTLFWAGPPASEVYRLLVDVAIQLGKLEFYSLFTQFRTLLDATRDVIIPMTIGGVLVGGFLGLACYPLSVHGFRSFHDLLERRRAKRLARKGLL